MLSPSLAQQQAAEPDPPRIRAAAILRAYSERSVPLPVQDAAQWYGLGGRYWVLVWMVCGYRSEGDKFLGDDSIAWGLPLSSAETSQFWSELAELASTSDAWQAADGIDADPPKVDVAALLNRKIDWTQFASLRPVWSAKRASSTALVGFLREAYAQLKKWREKRQLPPSLQPLVPQKPSIGGGGGLILIIAAVLMLGGSRRSPSRRRRR